ncbi:hypothetical protein [uncultured Pseudonocardia sp.]|nr:hypothetical protein [uncultured Pseudonocardia sp.]
MHVHDPRRLVELDPFGGGEAAVDGDVETAGALVVDHVGAGRREQWVLV